MSELMHYREARGLEGLRVYAIGDVHGRSDLLGEMHRRISAEIERDQPDDWRVIHLGDYGDRGPDTRGVIDLIMGAKARDPRHMALCGNHDIGFLDFLDLPDQKSLFTRFGGVQTSASYGVDLDASDRESLLRSHETLMRAVPASHIAFLRGREFSAEFGDFFYCHAGIRPQVPLKLQTREDLMWIRRDFLDFEGLHPKVIVHGHTICAQPEITPARVNVDTGAYATGKLTAFVVEGAMKRLLTVSTGD
jgi:serine/threonine protein phosphatase 1